jgi:acyl carrier protein
VNVEELKKQIKLLIVKELQLEDLNPEDIGSDLPIFGRDPQGGGLGLDSIDALELSIAISRTFGVTIQPDDANQHQVFASVTSLAEYIEQQKAPSV